MENNKRLPVLCKPTECTGCSACAQSCGNDAITMRLNDEGYYNPYVDSELCIGCKKCEMHCPILHSVAKHEEVPVAYSAWITDAKARSHSSSGGVFSAIALSVLKDGGIVWGAGYDENLHPLYKCIERAEDLDELRGSKYVQCEIGNSFKTIKSQLKDGRKVLFCGTPCHVAGLFAYLGGKLTEKLLTIDFICHGVPSSQLFRNYIGWLEEKYRDKAVGFNFRESKFGINYNVGTSVTFRNKGKKFLYLADNSYTLGFCRELTIHDSCGMCKFDGIQRHADFTVGDYHGAKKEYSTFEQFNGISCLMINSQKALEVFENLNIHITKVPLEKIVSTNPNYTKHRMSSSTLLLDEVLNLPYQEIQRKYFSPSLKDIIKTAMMILLGGKLTYIIRNKM